MKTIIFCILALLAAPLSLLVVWVATALLLESNYQLVSPALEVALAVISGLAGPVLSLLAIFRITRAPSFDAAKQIRICGVIGTVVAIVFVLLAIKWIMLGIAFRGVRM